MRSFESRNSVQFELFKKRISQVEPVSATIHDIRIEIGASAPVEMITKVIKSVRYAY